MSYQIIKTVQCWYNDSGQAHRDGYPAVVCKNNNVTYRCEWYQEGKLHRDGDQPAIIDTEYPEKGWYQHGKLHREGDEPSHITQYSIGWIKNGKLHRDNKPASISLVEMYSYPEHCGPDGVLHPKGTEEWFQYGELHRAGGPAIVCPNGLEEWYQKGKLHRMYGPAVTYPDGSTKWYEYGIRVNKYN